MSPDKLILVGFWVVATALWVLSITKGWAGRLYDVVGPDSYRWLWLRVAKVPRTRGNCVRFLNAVSAAGIVLMALVVGIIVLRGR